MARHLQRCSLQVQLSDGAEMQRQLAAGVCVRVEAARDVLLREAREAREDPHKRYKGTK